MASSRCACPHTDAIGGVLRFLYRHAERPGKVAVKQPVCELNVIAWRIAAARRIFRTYNDLPEIV